MILQNCEKVKCENIKFWKYRIVKVLNCENTKLSKLLFFYSNLWKYKIVKILIVTKYAIVKIESCKDGGQFGLKSINSSLSWMSPAHLVIHYLSSPPSVSSGWPKTQLSAGPGLIYSLKKSGGVEQGRNVQSTDCMVHSRGGRLYSLEHNG